MGIFSSSWERQVDNNLFDLIDVAQFRNYRIGTLYNYLLMWALLILHTALHAVDVYTCIKLLAFNSWSSEVKPTLPFKVSKWLFAGCIIFSMVWLIFGALKAIRVYRTRNISLTYTNEMARNMCSIGNYNKFCVLNEINPTGSFDKIAFYTYFQYANCLGLLLSDSPRQVINAITLWSVFKIQSGQFLTTIKEISTKNRNEALILYGMSISFVIWIFFIVEFFFALMFTLPVYFRILHTLKFQSLRQYVCIKVDKTVKQVARKHQKKSLEKIIHSKYSYDNLLSEKPSIPNVELTKLQSTEYHHLSKSSTFDSVASLPENPFSEQYTNPFRDPRDPIKKPIQSHYRPLDIRNEPYGRVQTFNELKAENQERSNPFRVISEAQKFDEYTRPGMLDTHDAQSDVSVYGASNYSSEFVSKTTLKEFPPRDPSMRTFPPRKVPEGFVSHSSLAGSSNSLLPSSNSQASSTQCVHKSSSDMSLTQPERPLLKSQSQTSLNSTHLLQHLAGHDLLNSLDSSSSQESERSNPGDEDRLTRDAVRPSLYARARDMELEDYSRFTSRQN